MIIRDRYLRQLIQLKDLNVIKVVTGIRRAGKSTILAQFREYLAENGVKKANILSYNLEDKKLKRFTEDPDALHDEILAKIDPKKMNYVFIDEVQNVPEFEKTIDSLFIRENIDLYITGSNAYITSSELGTLISGRYVEIKMQPLTFAEFVRFFPDSSDRRKMFELFLRFGGFPEVANFLVAGAEEQVPIYLANIYETILEKDIKTHFGIDDLADFRRVVRFMFDSVGKPISSNSISNASDGQDGMLETIPRKRVKSYIDALVDCFVFYDAERYDIRGKQLLKTQDKYYAVDLGLTDAVLGRPSNAEYGRKLENLVYLELRQRYQSVYVGKNYGKEIDFVARDENGIATYYQVSWTAMAENTLERELAAFRNTGDSYRKILLTMDDFPSNEDGIERKNVVEWLLGE